MKIIVRVDLVTDWGDTATVQVDQIERPSQNLEPNFGWPFTGGRETHSQQSATDLRPRPDG